MTKVGSIGLGNVGGKLAASVLRNGFDNVIDAVTSEAIRAYVISEANSGHDAAYYESVGSE